MQENKGQEEPIQIEWTPRQIIITVITVIVLLVLLGYLVVYLLSPVIGHFKHDEATPEETQTPTNDTGILPGRDESLFTIVIAGPVNWT